MKNKVQLWGFCALSVPIMCPFRESKGCKYLKDMVGTRRLELLTSTVSRQRSNQLSYAPTSALSILMPARGAGNRRPAISQVALG